MLFLKPTFEPASGNKRDKRSGRKWEHHLAR